MNRANTRSYAFDDRDIRWYTLGDFEHFVFAMSTSMSPKRSSIF
jgi:hypothetical protein